MSERKIRVLQLIDNFTMGGAERVVLMLASHLDRNCFDVIPCTLHHSGPLEEEFKTAGLDYRVLNLKRHSVLTGPLFLADMRRMLNTLSAALTTLSIDIIHSHLNNSSLVGIRAARQSGTTRACATVHNIQLGTQRSRWSLRERLMRVSINVVYSQADRVIAVSDEVSDALHKSTRIPSQHIVTIPNGVDPHRFQLQQDRATLRQQLALPADRPIIISIGRLTRQKGYPYLLDALAQIPSTERPLSLIVGDGPERQALESQAANLQLTQDIMFLGNRYDIPQLLAAADCFALASLWEGLPLVLLEAMASGLPAVVTEVGGNPQLLKHGETGYLVTAANSAVLSNALRSLLHCPQQRMQMGQAARERFEHYFSLNRFIKDHEQLYRQILTEASISAIA